jgi:hypothetical protein
VSEPIPTFSKKDELVTAAEAARLIAPHLPDRDPAAWLKDMRRADPQYRARVRRLPFVRRGRNIYYRRGDVLSVIEELGTVAHAEIHRTHGTAAATPRPGAPCLTAVLSVGGTGEPTIQILPFFRRPTAIGVDVARRLARDLADAADAAERIAAST